MMEVFIYKNSYITYITGLKYFTIIEYPLEVFYISLELFLEYILFLMYTFNAAFYCW